MFTEIAKNRVMNMTFGGVTGLMPTAFSIGLSTTTPSADGTGITEPPLSSGYERVDIGLFPAASDGRVFNETVISFPTFAFDAGVATHYVLYDQNGAPFWFAPLNSPKHMEADTVFAFKVGNLEIRLNDEDITV